MSRFGTMRLRLALIGLAMVSAAANVTDALAGEGHRTARHLQLAVPDDGDEFGAVSAPYTSLANVAPGILTWLNGGPVFGLPGTVTGDLSGRTQLTGDWGGQRTELARKGLFFDLYTSTAYQRVSGGQESTSSFIQNFQLTANVDTGRAGLWAGGLFHFAAQAMVGSDISKINSAGSFVPTYMGTLLPGTGRNNDIELTEYFLTQAIGKEFLLLAGRVGGLYGPDRTLFGDQWFSNFANFNFNENPLYGEFYTPTPYTVYGVWTPVKQLSLVFGVFDPNSQPDKYGDIFTKGVNLFGQASVSYEAGGLPGQALVESTWTNKPKLDLSAPVESWKDHSAFVSANVSQYLYVIDSPKAVAGKLRSGQPLRGLGVFARAGYADESTNPITGHASVALFGNGIWDARQRDKFGLGVFYNGVSGDLKQAIRDTQGRSVSNEWGMEGFYNLALTPALSLIVSYQHVWNPFLVELSASGKDANVFQARLTAFW